jgi:hypothetical protein
MTDKDVIKSNIPQGSMKSINNINTSIQASHDEFKKAQEFKNLVNEQIESAINPSHYQGYIEELQWIEAMSRIPTLKSPEKFKAALELQVRKYLDRNGQKDTELQELKKALWYMKALVAYVANGCQPLNVSEIDRILSEV